MAGIPIATVRAREAVNRALTKADRQYNNRQADGTTTPVIFMDEADRMVSVLREELASDPTLDARRVARAITHLADSVFISTFNASREAFNPFFREVEARTGLASRSLGTVKPGNPTY